MSEFIDKISGSLCYFNNFSVSDISGSSTGTINNTVKTIKSNMKSKYIHLCYDENDCNTLRDIKISQEFLHPSGLPFMPVRIVISDFTILHETFPIKDSVVMFTMFPEIGTATLAINLNFENATTDQIVFFRQCSGNNEKFRVIKKDGTEEMLSITEIFNKLVLAIEVPTDAFNMNYLLEINEFGQNDNLQEAIVSEPERVYGLLTGDEGWFFINRELALDRLSQNWGSRKFVNFVAFGSNFLLFNLNNSNVEKDYEIHQKFFSTKYYGAMNEYFSMKSKFAGVNHGILFSIETVMAMKTVTKYILDKQTFFNSKKIENFNSAIKRTKSYRKDLMLTLNKLEEIDISELGELENLVLKSQHIDPIIEKIKYLLELLESDLTLMYSQQTNKLINLLTIFGLLFTIIQTIVSVYSLF